MNQIIKQALRVVAIVVLSLFAIALAIAFLSLPGCSMFKTGQAIDTGCDLELTAKEVEMKMQCKGDFKKKEEGAKEGEVNINLGGK